MEIVNVGSAAFWFMLAVVIVSSDWFRLRSEAIRHETLRRILERTGQIDEAQLKALFQTPTPSWLRDPPPGAGYRALRVLGTIVMFVALGLTVFFTILWQTGPARHDSAMIGFASTSVIALVGIGLFFSSRFLPAPPPVDRSDRA